VGGAEQALVVSPAQLTLASGGQHEQELTVDAVPCFDDAGREDPGAGCRITLAVEIRDIQGNLLSQESRAVIVTALGQHLDAGTFNLVAPAISLTPSQAQFAVEDGTTSLPSPVLVQIGSVNGVPLPGLTASLQYTSGQTNWLAQPVVAGTGLLLQPTRTNLPVGRHSAEITIRSSIADVPARNLAVIYDITPIPQFPVTIVANGTGSGSVTLAPGNTVCVITGGVTAPTGCVLAFDRGTAVTATAVAQPGSSFAGWIGVPGCGLAAACQLTVFQARTLTVSFASGCDPRPYTLGTTITGTVGPGSCRVFGRGDAYFYNVAAQTTFEMHSSSPDGGTFQSLIAGWGIAGSEPLQDIVGIAVVAPGRHTLWVGINDTAAVGGYMMSTGPGQVDCVNSMWVSLGVSFSGSLDSGCPQYFIGTTGAPILPARPLLAMLRPNERISVTANGVGFDPVLELRGPGATLFVAPVLASTAAGPAGPTASLTYTATPGGQAVVLWLTSRSPNGIGPYSITIDPSNLAPSVPPSSPSVTPPRLFRPF
jgi:hypothetical protein